MLGSGLATEIVSLEAVDGVDVTVVIDNFVDVLMAGATATSSLPSMASRRSSRCGPAASGCRCSTTVA